MRLACAALGVFAAAAAAAATDPLPACGPLSRPYEAVEIPVSRLVRLGRTPLARIGVVAFRDGRAEPIPFQVDERRGRKIALADGPEPLADDRPGVLDGDDLLVFMACDAGERKDARALPDAGVETWRELVLRDPRTGAVAFAYVLVSEHPPLSPRRYVDYAPEGDLVATEAYRVGLVSALPTYLTLLRDGVPTPNLLDGPRLRVQAALRANLATLSLHEGQGRHALIAWKRGPVRVVRRSRHWVSIGFGIHLTAGVANTYFYARHVYAPGSMRLPFSPGIFFRDISAVGGADGRDLRGWRYHAAGVPKDGFEVDGRMDPVEARFDAHGDWFALATRDRAMLFAVRLSENLARAIPLRLVYRDDAAAPYPPEELPGTTPLVGFAGRHVERLPGGRYQFALHIFAPPAFQPGDERELLATIDHRLTADVVVPEDPRSSASAAR